VDVASRPLRVKNALRKPGDDRSDFQHDRDIILYSTALKRLSGITQVVSAETGHVFHNRLTHSLQVSQVGRRLAEKLVAKQPELAKHYGIEVDAVEAACLAHDLGHPPFGHLAESALNRLAGDAIEGFEGNAQSFRILTELAFRSDEYSGLNLTYQTLRGVLKYPWTYRNRPDNNRNKWGAYSTELGAFNHATLNSLGGPVPRTPEAEIMDWADDLTYAIHDVEDFYRAGLIPLHLLRPPQKGTAPVAERDVFLAYVWSKRDSISELDGSTENDLTEYLSEPIFAYFKLQGPYQGSRDDRARLRWFTGSLVGRYINGLTLAEPGGTSTVVRKDGYEKEIAVLKQLTWRYVIEAPGLAVQQHAQRQMIRYLFNAFLHETNRTPSRLIPPYYRERLADVVREHGPATVANRRVVVDLIAGMTESQAYALYHRLNGVVSGSALDHVL
jgi:dGTPase